jgi:hypothetical protein
MESIFLGLGITLILASILGGGIKAFSIEIPVIKSKIKLLIILFLGILSLSLFLYIRSISENRDKGSIDLFRLNKIEVGWDNSLYKNNLNTGNITYNNIRSLDIVDNRLIFLTYEYRIAGTNEIGIGDMAFILNKDMLTGFYRDISNIQNLKPGKIQLFLNLESKTAEGWWSDGIHDEKYNAYLRMK